MLIFPSKMKVKCPHCPKSFRKDHLDEHVKRVHKENKTSAEALPNLMNFFKNKDKIKPPLSEARHENQSDKASSLHFIFKY